MKQFYQHFAFRTDTIILIETMNDIITDYIHQGYRLTVRQLYYQLVARGHIENTEKSYKRTTSIVNDARLAGLMDWDVIEDRTRSFIRRGRWASPAQIVRAVAEQFHMDMWQNQGTRVFCIVEKEALAGVLERVCNQYDVPLLAARGYPSGTVLREFVLSDLVPAFDAGQDVLILHLGDHDPSGLDMTRDLNNRIAMFCEESSYQMTLKRIALSMDQINDQQPPPNPAKTTDARFANYGQLYGNKSWELDALSPSFLHDLVETEITAVYDPDLWKQTEERIEDAKYVIHKAALQLEKAE
jgi:hypothetical protein